jgi:hypothetical protein
MRSKKEFAKWIRGRIYLREKRDLNLIVPLLLQNIGGIGLYGRTVGLGVLVRLGFDS